MTILLVILMITMSIMIIILHPMKSLPAEPFFTKGDQDQQNRPYQHSEKNIGDDETLKLKRDLCWFIRILHLCDKTVKIICAQNIHNSSHFPENTSIKIIIQSNEKTFRIKMPFTPGEYNMFSLPKNIPNDKMPKLCSQDHLCSKYP